MSRSGLNWRRSRGNVPHRVGLRFSAQLGTWKDGGSGELGRTRVAADQATYHGPFDQSTGAMLPLNTRLDDDGDVHFRRWQRTTGADRASPIAILGRWCRLGLAWDGRSHHVPTLDRRRMRWQGGSQRLKVDWSRPWRIIAVAHRPPPPGLGWKSNDVVQKELQVAELEDELACMRLLHMARAARLAPPCVLAMLQTEAAAAWRSAVVKDMGVHVPAPFAQA